jgi:hydroxyacylglutathione hydrolase
MSLANQSAKTNNVKNVAAVSIFPTGPASCNCVLVLDRETGHLVIVNPGGDFSNIIAELKTLCIEAGVGLNKVRLAYILITQAHTQLFLTAGKMLAIGNGAGKIILHKDDWFLWERAELQAQELDFAELLPEDGEGFPIIEKTGRSFEQGEELIDCGNLSVICLHTPGVSPGSACYYFPQLELVCTGTTLLSHAVGRTTWTGIQSLEGTSSARTLRRSIDEVLLASVPGDTRVIPAFGPLTSLRHEAQKNAHLQKLSSRWGSYDDTQELKNIQQARAKKLRDDPFGDGLPF